MNPEKRMLIVKEIEHWRKSKLLPEQYCDFLLNLYMERTETRPPARFGFFKKLTDRKRKIWFGGLGLFFGFTLFSFYFNSFPLPLQIGISIVFLLSCYFTGFLVRRTNPVIAHLFVGIASLYLLAAGLYLIGKSGLPEPYLLGYAVICSFLWLLAGIVGRMWIYHVFGWIGIAAVYGWILQQHGGMDGWFRNQIGWLPFSALFICLSRLIHRKYKDTANVFFFVGILYGLAPELLAIAAAQGTDASLSIPLLAKILLAGLFLYLFRTQ